MCEVALLDPGSSAVGFELDACLRREDAATACANDAAPTARSAHRKTGLTASAAGRSPPAVLAPMAGVTDRPFRVLCRSLGAGLAASEMITSDTRLWSSRKSRQRMNHEGEPEPRVVQLAGAEPEALAGAARRNAELGAQIIDINMGCPAKKVCNRLCGSALLQDEALVGRILAAVVAAVAPFQVPVTLKTRTGWDRTHRNGPQIARIAEESGIAAIAIHGRTRADFYEGDGGI